MISGTAALTGAEPATGCARGGPSALRDSPLGPVPLEVAADANLPRRALRAHVAHRAEDRPLRPPCPIVAPENPEDPRVGVRIPAVDARIGRRPFPSTASGRTRSRRLAASSIRRTKKHGKSSVTTTAARAARLSTSPRPAPRAAGRLDVRIVERAATTAGGRRPPCRRARTGGGARSPTGTRSGWLPGPRAAYPARAPRRPRDPGQSSSSSAGPPSSTSRGRRRQSRGPGLRRPCESGSAGRRQSVAPARLHHAAARGMSECRPLAPHRVGLPHPPS